MAILKLHNSQSAGMSDWWAYSIHALLFSDFASSRLSVGVLLFALCFFLFFFFFYHLDGDRLIVYCYWAFIVWYDMTAPTSVAFGHGEPSTLA